MSDKQAREPVEAEEAGPEVEEAASGTTPPPSRDERWFWFWVGAAVATAVVSMLWTAYFVYLEGKRLDLTMLSAPPPAPAGKALYARSIARLVEMEVGELSLRVLGAGMGLSQLEAGMNLARDLGMVVLDLGGEDQGRVRSALVSLYGAGSIPPLVCAPLEEALTLESPEAAVPHWGEFAYVDPARGEAVVDRLAEQAASAARKLGLACLVVEPPQRGDLDQARAKALLDRLGRQMMRYGVLPLVAVEPGSLLPTRPVALLVRVAKMGAEQADQFAQGARLRGYTGLMVADLRGAGTEERPEGGLMLDLFSSGYDLFLVSDPLMLKRVVLSRSLPERITRTARLVSLEAWLGVGSLAGASFPPITSFEVPVPLSEEELEAALRGEGEEVEGELPTPPQGAAGEEGEQVSPPEGDRWVEQAPPDQSGQPPASTEQTGERVPPTPTEPAGPAYARIKLAATLWAERGRELTSRPVQLIGRGIPAGLADALKAQGVRVVAVREVERVRQIAGYISPRMLNLVVLNDPSTSEQVELVDMGLPLNHTRLLAIWQAGSEFRWLGRFPQVRVVVEGPGNLPLDRIAQFLTSTPSDQEADEAGF